MPTESLQVSLELLSGLEFFDFELTSKFFGEVLKVNTKKHLEDLVKDRDTWKNRCIQIWKDIALVLDLISPELPKN